MKTVGIREQTHKELKTLCKTHKKSIAEFLHLGVVYFKQTGINPEQSENESPQKSIRELSKRVEQIIGVLKSQEQDKMNPLLESLMMLSRRTEMLLNDAPKESTFKTVLSRTEDMIEADQTHHLDQLKTQHTYYEQLEKNHVKSNEQTVSKMNEAIEKLDKMTALLQDVTGKK